MTALRHEERWTGDLTRVPYWVFQSEDLYRREHEVLFRREGWHFVGLEAEVPKPGDFRTTQIGAMPLIVARDPEGRLHCFENRCAHRGALLCPETAGNTRLFKCVYHSWAYDLQGRLKGVAFKDGVGGQGGMPKDFDMAQFGLRELRVETICGLIFASPLDAAPPLADYLGEAIIARIRRVLDRPVVVLGRFTQVMPMNWKLYMENVKDSYHASLLHMFFTTFRLNRLTQRGGIIVDPSGRNHVSYSEADRGNSADSSYADQNLRADNKGFQLADPSVIQGFDEFGDDITLQILSVFPTFVLQQIRNSIAVRQIVPRGIDSTDLHWTYLGFVGDTPEQQRIRMKQSNLMGPAGYISMEDGAAGDFVRRGVAAAPDRASIVQMGGYEVESQPTRATETAVRGFWRAYREMMEV